MCRGALLLLVSNVSAHLLHSHSHVNSASPGPGVSAQFPLSAVRPTKGSLMDVQQQRNLQYLLSLDSTRLACLFTSAANLTGTWDKPTCEAYDHPQYWGTGCLPLR